MPPWRGLTSFFSLFSNMQIYGMSLHTTRRHLHPSGPQIPLYFQFSAFIQVVDNQHISPSTKCMHFLSLHVGAHCKLIEFTVPALINCLYPSQNLSLCVYALYRNSVFQNIFQSIVGKILILKKHFTRIRVQF
jgi:hypothetical protein